MRFIITIFGILVIAVSSAFSQTNVQSENKDVKKKYFYEWTDSKGTVNITDRFDKVPEQYRSKARKIEPPKPEESVSPERQVPAGVESSHDYGFGNAEAEAKAQWQQRIRSWQQQLANAEKRYQDLDRERKELFRAWGSAALAPIENRLRAEQIEQQMKEVQQEIDKAKNMIEVVIPEEARKAGVPPGWLRE